MNEASAIPGMSVRAIDRYAYAHDASHYLLVPSAVVTPSSAGEVAELFRRSRLSSTPLVFRSGGTSLSGQGVTDGWLVDVRKKFRAIEVEDEGAIVRVQPGVTVRQVNARLARFGRKLGPDPASEISCTIGGVVANNSSGMECGTERNSYRTLNSMVFILPSGTVVDTRAADADRRLRQLEPKIHQRIVELTARVRGNPDSVRTIRRLFAMKDTMGYGINAFLDFDHPVDILAHLMIGSEGTLGFIAEVEFGTVELASAFATGLAIFPTLGDATGAIPELVESGPAAIELMDSRSLLVAKNMQRAPSQLKGLEVHGHAALLIEVQSADDEELVDRQASVSRTLGELRVVSRVKFTSDPRLRDDLWHVRKGLYAAVAGARPPGSNALLEDIVVPVDQLLPTCEALVQLFDKHEYEDSVIFGHARDGNIHFMLNERFENAENLDRYRRFTDDMAEIVLGNGGSLKAEHGTGRMMAPFVRRQYGDELYNVMLEIKRMCDPVGQLNPGVLLSDDPVSYLRNLKHVPDVEEEVNRCVECGYCEPVCPSRDLTTTPRQRIALRREIARAEGSGDQTLVRELRQDYEYDGIQTCAVDGMCQVVCPVNINTGDLVRRLRKENSSVLDRSGWAFLARYWSGVTGLIGAVMTAVSFLPSTFVTVVSRVGRMLFGEEKVPLYDRGLPRGGKRRHPKMDDDAVAVYFPSCIGAMFAAEGNAGGAQDAFLALCERADIRVAIPKGIGRMCCGTPWKSKGYESGYNTMMHRVVSGLVDCSQDGALPIVCDASSCTEGLIAMVRNSKDPRARLLRFVDSIEFVNDRMLDTLTVHQPLSSIMLHPTCSSSRLGIDDKLRRIAKRISPTVTVPTDWGCCGFAGDRGMLHPELTESATAAQLAEIASVGADHYASCNRTCEIGMSRATGEPYRHLLELLEVATR